MVSGTSLLLGLHGVVGRTAPSVDRRKLLAFVLLPRIPSHIFVFLALKRDAASYSSSVRSPRSSLSLILTFN